MGAHLRGLFGVDADGGSPDEPNGRLGGIAPGGCTPHDNAVSFSFANTYGGAGRIIALCGVVAQETAHAYAALGR